MNLPYPFEHRGRTVRSADVKSPTGGVLADAARAAENGNEYKAVHVYVVGSVAALYDGDGSPVDDPRDALLDAPYFLAEWLAFQSLVKAGASDEVEVPYHCPKCGRDFEGEAAKVSEMTLRGSAEPPRVLVPFGRPVEFKDSKTGEVLDSVSAVTLRLPSLGDCVRCGNKGISDETRLQYAVWGEAVLEVNGQEVNQTWRGAFGAQTFERADLLDVRNVGLALNDWAIDNTVPAKCPKCKKQFRQEVPTGSFFAYALRAR
jgi:DNA-directed RNA polymerase subunit RPC12/RpoP